MSTTRWLIALVACTLPLGACSSEQDGSPAPEVTTLEETTPEAGAEAGAATPPETDPASNPAPDPELQPDSEPVPESDAAEQAEGDAATGMDLYRRAQALMQEGKKQEGYETAQAAMRKFIDEGDDLAWMMLESVEVGDKRIDVHFNMGPRERDTTLDGIVRPLSFRVWSAGEDSKLLRTLDYENGRFDGQVLTAAIGEQRGTVHGNLGMLEPGVPYEEIVQKVVEIVEGM